MKLEALEVCLANLSTPQADEGGLSGTSGQLQQLVGPDNHRFWSPCPGPTDDDLEIGQVPNKAGKSKSIVWHLSYYKLI